MTLEEKKSLIRTVFLYLIGIVVVYWLLHETDRVLLMLKAVIGLISPFIAGSVIAFILNVPMRGLEGMLGEIRNKGVRRGVALLLTIFLILLVIALVFLLLIPQLKDTIKTLVQELPAFGERVVNWVIAFSEEHPQIVQWIAENTSLESFDMPTLVQKAASLVGDGLTAVVNSTASAVGSITSGIVNAVIALVFAVYALLRKEILAVQFKKLLYSFLPARFCDKAVQIMRLTNATFSNFISGQCLEACNLGLMFAVAMLIFRMPYVPLVSVLVAVTALVPVVGAFVGCVLGAFFILVDNPILALWFVLLFLVLQQIENNLVYPRVVGNSIGLPSMWVLVAVTIGGSTMGVFGMLFMIPFVSVLYTLLREITDKRLAERGIERDRLDPLPMEHESHPKVKREKTRGRWKTILKEKLGSKNKNQ